FLTDKEQENNVRLSCQCKVKEDIQIEIPEELFNGKEYDAVVGDITDLTSIIKSIRIKLPNGQEVNFKAGQYMQLKAPIYEGNDEEVYRAYSIASSPSEKTFIDLIIGYVPEGVATTYVHHHLNPNDAVNLNGAYGDFYYQDNDREMILVAVGTGVAPILSILNYMKENNIERKAKFYFGAKTPEDLFMLDYFEEMEDTLYDFEFIPCLSRVTEEHNWDGFKGRVNNALEELLMEAEDKEAYLCGSEPMIDSVVDVLTKKGILEEDLFMLDYFEEMEDTLYDFEFIPCLSRVTEEHNWDGFKGRVNNALEELLMEAEDKEAYLCGSEPMIDSVVDVLTKKGIPE